MDGNTRAISIFTTYMLTNISLCALILRDIYTTLSSAGVAQNQFSRIRAKTNAHSVLAVICLGITWYYMISFFSLSYRSWAYENQVDLPNNFYSVLVDPSSIKLGLWLKDVKLFRDAWEVVVETPGRLCWSQPIFFITAGWSFYIAMEAHRRNISHAWAYMVLGQLVAISFAMNLFFIAVLSHQIAAPMLKDSGSSRSTTKGRSDQERNNGLWTPPIALYSIITIITIASVAIVPGAAGSADFLKVLSISHILLLLPPILCKDTPSFMRVRESTGTFEDLHITQFWLIAVSFLGLQSYALWQAFHDVNPDGHLHRHSNVYARPSWVTQHLLPSFTHALWDHPAVSSVGWDSLLCTTSIFVAIYHKL